MNQFLQLSSVIFCYFYCLHDYCNMHQTVQTSFRPFPSLFRKTASMLIPLSALIAALFQTLHNNIPPAILVAMHVKWATVNANTEHIEILDAGAQQVLVILFSDGEWTNMHRKKLCAMIEKTIRLQDERVHVLVSLEIRAAKALCVAKLLWNLSFPTGLFTWPKNAPKTQLILPYPTWLNSKMLNSEKGLMPRLHVSLVPVRP